MRFRNTETGRTLELPPPDELGASVLKVDGVVVEHLLYSDESRTITTGGGTVFRSASKDFYDFVFSLVERSGETR